MGPMFDKQAVIDKIYPVYCPGGEIGKRAGLKIQ